MNQQRTAPNLPDRLGFKYLWFGSSERQCGQSNAAFCTGSAQDGQSLLPLARITLPTVRSPYDLRHESSSVSYGVVRPQL